jgi:hypothetical protein
MSVDIVNPNDDDHHTTDNDDDDDNDTTSNNGLSQSTQKTFLIVIVVIAGSYAFVVILNWWIFPSFLSRSIACGLSKCWPRRKKFMNGIPREVGGSTVDREGSVISSLTSGSFALSNVSAAKSESRKGPDHALSSIF